MSAKINKNGKEYPIGVIPQNYPASNIKMANGESVEDALTWKLLGNITTTSSDLPNVFEELLIVADSSNAGICTTLSIPKIVLTNTEKTYGVSNYYSASANFGMSIKATATTIRVNWVSANGNDVTSNSTVKVYYR